ncbi:MULTISPECIES: molybdopterin synthase catalytic subunit MoaE [unclassified Microbulbifer]|uniref:molybdopterin synthase catalytic subunit MoaE n=1 Tax=unclassified Microbulbifer TaxID=2619833 RepID=UPI0027E59095|nr:MULTISPECIES: molybdopterin synthase catalytic subunit MoaE [unclassified Microbulbifer]
MAVSVAVQLEAFDVGAEYAQLRAENTRDGAAAMFVGSVRDFNLGTGVNRLELEHYPGMTERVLGDIAEQACRRWQLGRVRIVHRIGPLDPGEDIVFVGATAEHRQAALDACAFIMDWLKSRAPFWKKERGPGGERWVEARESDREALEKW